MIKVNGSIKPRCKKGLVPGKKGVSKALRTWHWTLLYITKTVKS